MSLLGGIDPKGIMQNIAVTERGEVFTATKLFDSGMIFLPGVVTGSAYAANDAFSSLFEVSCPNEGTLVQANFYDYDYEMSPKLVLLYDSPVSVTAADAALANTDAVNRHLVMAFAIGSFTDMVTFAFGVAQPMLYYKLPGENLKMHCQIVTQGTDNIAAGSVPSVRFLFA